MEKIYDTKAEIVKGTSKSGNPYYGMKVYLTNTYASFTILQNADEELVKTMERDLTKNNNKNE